MSQLNENKINKENLNKGNICIAFIKKQNTDYFQFDTFYLLNYIDSLELSDVLNLYQEKVAIYNNGCNGQTQGTPVNTFELVKLLLQKYPNRFNHDEVEKRAKELAQYAKEIWKIEI